MTVEMGNVIRRGRRMGEYISFDNGKAAISWGTYPEENVPKNIGIFDSLDELKSVYKDLYFKPAFTRDSKHLEEKK